MGDFEVERLTDKQLRLTYKLVEMTQSNDILADGIDDDLHQEALEASKALHEEMEKRGMEL